MVGQSNVMGILKSNCVNLLPAVFFHVVPTGREFGLRTCKLGDELNAN